MDKKVNYCFIRTDSIVRKTTTKPTSKEVEVFRQQTDGPYKRKVKLEDDRIYEIRHYDYNVPKYLLATYEGDLDSALEFVEAITKTTIYASSKVAEPGSIYVDESKISKDDLSVSAIAPSDDSLVNDLLNTWYKDRNLLELYRYIQRSYMVMSDYQRYDLLTRHNLEKIENEIMQFKKR